LKISEIFGANLRKLCDSKRSLAAVARDVDVSRVQLVRFINGESFPKPAVLKRITDYFGVDARIYTERLTKDQLAIVYAGKEEKHTASQSALGMQGLIYALAGRTCFGHFDRLPNQCVIMWRKSFSQPDRYFSMMLKIGVFNGCKIIRGYEPAVRNSQLFMEPQLEECSEKPFQYNDREIRGHIAEMGNGFIITYFPPVPRVTVSSSYLHFKDEWVELGLLPGVTMLNRLKSEGIERVSNTVMEFLPQSMTELMARGRACGFHAAKEVPPRILDFLKQPV
jgi:transcriptional regulator with XRE-family HTH domain